jgi:hypothetical protein
MATEQTAREYFMLLAQHVRDLEKSTYVIASRGDPVANAEHAARLKQARVAKAQALDEYRLHKGAPPRGRTVRLRPY